MSTVGPKGKLPDEPQGVNKVGNTSKKPEPTIAQLSAKVNKKVFPIISKADPIISTADVEFSILNKNDRTDTPRPLSAPGKITTKKRYQSPEEQHARHDKLIEKADPKHKAILTTKSREFTIWQKDAMNKIAKREEHEALRRANAQSKARPKHSIQEEDDSSVVSINEKRNSPTSTPKETSAKTENYFSRVASPILAVLQRVSPIPFSKGASRISPTDDK